jgi:nicotinate-nucleotide pyrophosphorylase (carboxylating)
MRDDALIQIALDEDIIGGRDATSEDFVDPQMWGEGWIEARQEGVISGLGLAMAVFHRVDPDLQLHPIREDSHRVSPTERVLEIEGSAISILKAERTALNFLCHLSGVATHTARFAELVWPWKTKILCTRKTLPGLRDSEIEAVQHGGGDAYRTNLSDAVLLKDNHIGMLGGMSGVKARLEEMRRHDPDHADLILRDGKIEAESLADIELAAAMGWRQVLLDNFRPEDVAEAVERWGTRLYLEVSGGVTLENVSEYAATGVHAISIGALTHSSKSVDFSLEVEWRHR